MPRWDMATRTLSRKVLEQIVFLGTPETNWWTSRDMVGKKLKIEPDALYDPVRLLIEEGDVESDDLDLHAVRATLRGWMKVPWAARTTSERALQKPTAP